MLQHRKAKNLLTDIYPREWQEQFTRSGQKVDIVEFDNVQHFKHYLASIQLNKGGAANDQKMPFKEALAELTQSKPVVPAGEFKAIKDEVRTVLQKRGLISENVYEGYQYDVEGEMIDIAEYIAGNPECMLKPRVKYKNHFYELFISGAYLSHVSNKTVRENISKILATIQLLELEHIYIKVTIVAASTDVVSGDTLLAVAIPLFSHKDEKTIDSMSSILNERFFRTFIFGIKEHMYGSKLSSGYGRTIDLKNAINLHNVDVTKIASNILDKIITPGTR